MDMDSAHREIPYIKGRKGGLLVVLGFGLLPLYNRNKEP